MTGDFEFPILRFLSRASTLDTSQPIVLENIVPGGRGIDVSVRFPLCLWIVVRANGVKEEIVDRRSRMR